MGRKIHMSISIALARKIVEERGVFFEFKGETPTKETALELFDEMEKLGYKFIPVGCDNMKADGSCEGHDTP